MSVAETEELRIRLEEALNKVVSSLGTIQIGNKTQFPYGWRKTAKGRTVWRILEEAITQNLEHSFKNLALKRLMLLILKLVFMTFQGNLQI